ncbi:aminotransferase class IV family protein [Roseinatronobacter sp. HJB301]|uniref:Probable branched-chain-amino-acid aminotransferase n=2 Tax=Roseinatronobacter alkalisoli TaxID=3028235 RepID=A0ABT5TBZ2_9RHOB|nr:aminotransferase class IV family protein [Roseinatronobacter sp. HJB301]MDD7972641.1 aminotransferase class IV family protein [Roseinatronobacter sp. HJB301]
MYWDGARARHWPLHLARLQAGARALGWPCPEPDVTGPAHPARLRLTLDAGGRLDVETHPLPPVATHWHVGLAQQRLCSVDPWLRIKSTRRAIYDTARAALPAGLDELILLNERDEVCDGTITTVFFDRGDGLRTPPLSAGLLPGVLRAALDCPEETLSASDLPHVQLWVGNALRGLIPASFVGGGEG